MCFLDFIKQHHGVWFATHGFGQLAALVITDVSGRRSDKSAHSVFLLILAHVDTGHHVLVVKQVFGQRLGKLGLADTCSAEEDKRADRAARVIQACTAAANGISYGCYGLVLAYHTVVEFGLKMEQFLLLALYHLVDRDSCPAGYHVGNIFRIHFLFDESFVALHHFQLFLDFGDFLLLLLNLAVTDFSYSRIVAVTFGLVGLEV